MFALDLAYGAADAFGIAAFVNTFVVSIQAIAGIAIVAAITWEGFKLLATRRLEHILEVIIVIAIAVGLIVAAPRIAAAIPGAAGFTLGLAGPWQWNDVIGDAVSLGLYLGSLLVGGMQSYLRLRRSLGHA